LVDDRDLEAFTRYFDSTGGVKMPGDLALLEYCAGDLGMSFQPLLKLLGYDGDVGTVI